MQHPSPGRARARVKTGKLLGSNFPLLASTSQKINHQRTATIEKPRSPYPLFWRPAHSAPGFACAGLGGVS